MEDGVVAVVITACEQCFVGCYSSVKRASGKLVLNTKERVTGAMH